MLLIYRNLEDVAERNREKRAERERRRQDAKRSYIDEVRRKAFEVIPATWPALQGRSDPLLLIAVPTGDGRASLTVADGEALKHLMR